MIFMTRLFIQIDVIFYILNEKENILIISTCLHLKYTL
jgi:hypothetical protein